MENYQDYSPNIANSEWHFNLPTPPGQDGYAVQSSSSSPLQAANGPHRTMDGASNTLAAPRSAVNLEQGPSTYTCYKQGSAALEVLGQFSAPGMAQIRNQEGLHLLAQVQAEGMHTANQIIGIAVSRAYNERNKVTQPTNLNPDKDRTIQTVIENSPTVIKRFYEALFSIQGVFDPPEASEIRYFVDPDSEKKMGGEHAALVLFVSI